MRQNPPGMSAAVTPLAIARAWGRIGCLGFGGPPAHVAMLRELCVEQHDWLTAEEFEHGVTATNLLPGPASTQLAVYCGWRVGGHPGAVIGGLAFILPGLLLIIALAALMLSDPPLWIRGAGAGAGAAVAAVAVHAGSGLMGPSWQRVIDSAARSRWVSYLLVGAVSTALLGPWLVLVLIGCGLVEVLVRRPSIPVLNIGLPFVPGLVAAATATGGLLALTWTALKVGALSYGGGFVIVPMMGQDAVDRFHWLTANDFASAVALGQITPGPVTHTVAVVGFGAYGVAGAFLAAAIAFLPSFAFIAVGAERFERLIRNQAAQAFMAGAGPAAIGAIIGSAVPLAASASETWQLIVLAVAAFALLVLRRGVVPTLLAAGAAGIICALAGAPVPG